jgi:hypothetical protein
VHPAKNTGKVRFIDTIRLEKKPDLKAGVCVTPPPNSFAKDANESATHLASLDENVSLKKRIAKLALRIKFLG